MKKTIIAGALLLCSVCTALADGAGNDYSSETKAKLDELSRAGVPNII